MFKKYNYCTFLCPLLSGNKKIWVHLALFGAALFYAANYSIAKWAMPEHIGPYAFIVLRVGFGALVFVPYYWFCAREPVQDKIDYLDFAICAFFGIALNMLAFFKGLSMTSSINASVLMLLAPILVVIFTAIGQHKKVPRLTWVGVLVAFLGAALLVNVGEFSLKNDGLIGDLLVLLNAASFAFYLYYVARLLRKYSVTTVTAFIFGIGFFMVLPVGYSELMAIDWTALPPKAIYALVYVLVCVTVLAYLFNTWAVQNSSSTAAGSYVYLQPLLATLIAVLLGMDSITWSKFAFGLLIVLGVWLVNKGR